jgi:3',5'-nucleoside bisphosphate phosphatase
MPARQPFTALCQSLAAAPSGRADLHVHSTHSDGEYTPAEVVDLARRSGLSAVAITDHDTMTAFAEARAAARAGLEVVSGVEVTTEHQGRELHLLGYFADAEDADLNSALGAICVSRRERFFGMIDRLRSRGVAVDDAAIPATAVLGRRNLAVMLADSGQVGSVREAFHRYLADDGPCALPKARLPLAEAAELITAAGGVPSLAHPPPSMAADDLSALKSLGVRAVEADHPRHSKARGQRLRAWAAALGMGVTAGSDCHGHSCGKPIGSYALTAGELAALRFMAG